MYWAITNFDNRWQGLFVEHWCTPKCGVTLTRYCCCCCVRCLFAVVLNLLSITLKTESIQHFFDQLQQTAERKEKVPTQYWYYASEGSLLLEKTIFPFLKSDQTHIIQSSWWPVRDYIKRANKEGAYAIFLKTRPTDLPVFVWGQPDELIRRGVFWYLESQVSLLWQHQPPKNNGD